MTDKNKRPSMKPSERSKKINQHCRKMQRKQVKLEMWQSLKQGQFRKRAVMEKGLNESQKQKHNWPEEDTCIEKQNKQMNTALVTGKSVSQNTVQREQNNGKSDKGKK